jgi:hypothetical protein
MKDAMRNYCYPQIPVKKMKPLHALRKSGMEILITT